MAAISESPDIAAVGQHHFQAALQVICGRKRCAHHTTEADTICLMLNQNLFLAWLGGRGTPQMHRHVDSYQLAIFDQAC